LVWVKGSAQVCTQFVVEDALKLRDEPARCQRIPGNKGDAGTGAHIDQPV
jgi:hypothetical protein